MPTVLVPITGSVLAWAIGEAGLSNAEVASQLGVSQSQIADWIAGTAHPSKTKFDQLRKLLDRPESVFFLASPPPSSSSATRFRSHASRTGPHTPTPEDLKAIKLAQNLQRVMRWLGEDRRVLEIPRASIGDPPEAVAEEARAWLGWSTREQIKAKDHEVAKLLRARIEQRGIIALNLTLSDGGFRGFSLPDSIAPVIAINTRDDIRARSFSYIHECGHLMLGIESICDASPASGTDTWCDNVAAAFLMPRPVLADYMLRKFHVQEVDSLEEVRWAANQLNVSYRAMARRFESLGMGVPGLYGKINKLISNQSRGGGVGGPPQTRARRKLQRYGAGFVGRLMAAEEEGELENADLVDLLNLSRAELKELRGLLNEGAE
ncbi:hypothetical protein Q0Z83_082450 [Actinoplanes sichuanensis]|uniref:Helix-turn-helix domain-containing protein n=1 Tax=Actinoplanes sichuanensis TaxID=512349 RepID=A0ABW4ACI9_9ACTN|nr:XRE family transcriptional regulator [Actinoplanes sichuanensis]BEL10054.1 hypothetical protein Q0Z83_082450 [Actinoplanes sichuanensis]